MTFKRNFLRFFGNRNFLEILVSKYADIIYVWILLNLDSVSPPLYLVVSVLWNDFKSSSGSDEHSPAVRNKYTKSWPWCQTNHIQILWSASFRSVIVIYQPTLVVVVFSLNLWLSAFGPASFYLCFCIVHVASFLLSFFCCHFILVSCPAMSPMLLRHLPRHPYSFHSFFRWCIYSPCPALSSLSPSKTVCCWHNVCFRDLMFCTKAWYTCGQIMIWKGVNHFAVVFCADRSGSVTVLSYLSLWQLQTL